MTIALEYLMPRIAGFNIVDCELKDRDTLYLLAREDYTQRAGWRDTQEPPAETALPKRVLALRLKNPEDKQWGHMQLTGMGISTCGMAVVPEEKLVVIDMPGRAWAQVPGGTSFEAVIPPIVDGGLKRGPVMRARSFGGPLMAATAGRQILVRQAPGHWEEFGPAMPLGVSEDSGFEDFDKFPDGDLYAGGDAGDLWRHDGKSWHRCHSPTAMSISALCCAGDGQMYLAAGDRIYRGIRDTWERLDSKASITLPLRDLCWFEDKLWATNDHGVWIVEDGELVEADIPPELKLCAGNLAVRDGVLLLAGYGGAAFKRDGQWTVLFHDHTVRDWLSSHRDKVWTPPGSTA